MEREANYTAVGAFVLLVASMAALFVYWYAGSADSRDYKRYEIYFQGSVSGLNRGSTVRYLGVEVGRVVAIRIDKRASDRVQVIADIDAGTPISDDTLASLSLQGVTGLLYIDLLAHADTKRRMDPVPSEQYPVIDSVQSSFDLFLASLPDLVGRASRVLSDENITSFTRTMTNLEKTSASLPATMKDAAEVVAQLKAALSDLRAAAVGARSFVDTAGPDLTVASERLRKISESLASTSANLDQLLSEHRQDVGLFLRDSLPEMERLLRDSRQAAQEFRELSRSLKADPSQLLYESNYRGVEIPR
ncbi:MAG TPA: MlaD family protein [Steroidobacteraceae bacterium]|jgi:phospholipid/cholesterol/gamma-HCH transport system substrate-binding protein|nr:MlaD family protein [Steroidobacteraceae bacterium]